MGLARRDFGITLRNYFDTQSVRCGWGRARARLYSQLYQHISCGARRDFGITVRNHFDTQSVRRGGDCGARGQQALLSLRPGPSGELLLI